MSTELLSFLSCKRVQAADRLLTLLDFIVSQGCRKKTLGREKEKSWGVSIFKLSRCTGNVPKVERGAAGRAVHFIWN